ncbi:hypothetical protein D3C72_1146440 [compost metagenome]
MAQQQNAQDQRCRLACPGAGDDARGRRVAENHLPLCRTRLRVRGQALGDIRLEAFLQLGRQRQAPVVEQMIVLRWHSVAIGARVADHQNLAPGFVAVYPPFFVAFTQTVGMPIALARGMALKPGVAMLRVQAAQATTEQARRKALDPGQLRRWSQLQG